MQGEDEKRFKQCNRYEAESVQVNTNEMDMAKHDGEKKWLLPTYMVDRSQHHK
jgi:hypothetical protein